MRKPNTKKRIGIFAGAFDPVHTGHLTFALKAIKQARLDQVYFLPERQPRSKPSVEHFGHRTAMLTRAIKPHKELAVLELPDIYFNVKRTLPKLQREFAGAELVFLLGSDTVLRLDGYHWPIDDLETFLSQAGLIIGMRSRQQPRDIKAKLAALPVPPLSTHILTLPTNHVSSSRIRYAFRHDLPVAGLLASVKRYAQANWLYVSVST